MEADQADSVGRSVLTGLRQFHSTLDTFSGVGGVSVTSSCLLLSVL